MQTNNVFETCMTRNKL